MTAYTVTCCGETLDAIDIFYPYDAIKRWVLECGQRHEQGFPGTRDTHLFNRTKAPTLWFAEAWTSKYFSDLGYRTWSETCHLQFPLAVKRNVWNACTPQVFELLGAETVDRLHKEIALGGIVKWANPDVIAYHPETHEWLFAECKRSSKRWPELGIGKSRDVLKPHQVQSLKLLSRVIPHARALVCSRQTGCGVVLAVVRP